MRYKKGILVFITVILLSLALGFNPDLVTGEEKYVTFLCLNDFTGPVGGLGTPGNLGAEDFFSDLNARGGVQGVKVKYIAVDTRYDLARAVSAFKRYRKEHKLSMINGVSTALAKTISPFLDMDKQIMITPGAGEPQVRLGRIFLWGLAYQNLFAASIDWMVEDWKKRGKPGKPVVGYMGWDNPMGREAILGGKEYAEKIGVKFLQPEYYPPGSLKHDVWLNRLAQGGANYIYLSGVDPASTNVIRDAYALGLTKNIQMFTDCYGPNMGVGLKAHSKELEGTIFPDFRLRGEELYKNPLSTRLWKNYRKTPISEMTEAYSLGIFWALPFKAALKVALNEVGYDKLDGEAMYQAYQKLAGMDIFHGLGNRCAYSPTSRQATDTAKFYKVTKGRTISITDWRVAPDAVSLYNWK